MGNPAISEVFEPGSVNKVITAAAALHDGVVTPQTVIEVPPTLKVANKILHDAEEHGLEHLTFAGVLAKSSNIGTVKVAQQLGPQRLYDMMQVVRLRQPQRPRSARREPRSDARAVRLVRHLDRQHPDRPGRLGQRDPGRLGLRDARQRRRPGRAQHREELAGQRRSRRRAQAAGDPPRRHARRRAADPRHARGGRQRAGHGAEGRHPRLPRRGQDRHGAAGGDHRAREPATTTAPTRRRSSAWLPPTRRAS